MRDALPKGWESTTLDELFDFKYGKGLPQHKRSPKGSVRVYGSNGMVGVHDRALTKGTTIIVGRKGSVGEGRFSVEKCWPIDTTYYIDEFAGDVPPNYWALYLKSLQLGRQEKSSAIPGISRDDIYEIEVPLPPLYEQRRIVAKLEKLLGKVDDGQKRLEKVPIILKRFRQSVLASACSGHLTAEWRELHKVLPMLRANISELAELPDSWTLKRVKELASAIRGSIQSGPFGSNLLHSEFQSTGILAIGIDNVLEGKFSLGKQHRISPQKYEVLKKYTARPFDVLVTVMATVGRSCVVPVDIETAIITKHVYRISCEGKCVNPYYLLICFRGSPIVDDQVQSEIRGATRPGINGAILKEIQVPLPPLAEQQEIVRRVEALFELADHIESRYQKAKAHVNKLTQSILAKAFRGELVPQDPNDESATVLLERVRNQRLRESLSSTKRHRQGL